MTLESEGWPPSATSLHFRGLVLCLTSVITYPPDASWLYHHHNPHKLAICRDKSWKYLVRSVTSNKVSCHSRTLPLAIILALRTLLPPFRGPRLTVSVVTLWTDKLYLHFGWLFFCSLGGLFFQSPRECGSLLAPHAHRQSPEPGLCRRDKVPVFRLLLDVWRLVGCLVWSLTYMLRHSK